MFIDKIENSNPTDMQIIEDNMQLFEMDANEAINEAEDTITMFKSYIGQLGIDSSKREKLEKAIVDLYQEAIAIQ
jgi:methionine-rich copper-binding protein CopC